MNEKEIENLEIKYLNIIKKIVSDNTHEIIQKFSEEVNQEDFKFLVVVNSNMKQSNAFAEVFERNMMALIVKEFPLEFRPNSFTSDARFVFDDVVLQIDIKTANTENKSDYDGKVPLGPNQHTMDNIIINDDFPEIKMNSHIKKYLGKKPVLSLIISAIYEKPNFELFDSEYSKYFNKIVERIISDYPDFFKGSDSNKKKVADAFAKSEIFSTWKGYDQKHSYIVRKIKEFVSKQDDVFIQELKVASIPHGDLNEFKENFVSGKSKGQSIRYYFSRNNGYDFKYIETEDKREWKWER